MGSLNLQLESSNVLNFNSVEALYGYESGVAYTVNPSSVFREDVDIVPTIIDDSLSYISWGSVRLVREFGDLCRVGRIK